MNSLRQIPLHMLLLAGLVSPMQAKNKDNETPAAKAAATDEVAYAGLNVGPRVEAANATVTAGTTVKALREIVNCKIHAARVETAPNARIVGGSIEAADEVDAGIIGSPHGVPTEITVLRGSPAHPPVVRARRSIHSRVVLRVHHAVLNVDDDYKGTSFWEFEGEISQLGPAASAPKAA